MPNNTDEQVVISGSQVVNGTPPNDDLSFRLLSEIFGSQWTDAILGQSTGKTQLLLHLFSIFNSIAFSAISMIMLYIIIRGVIGAGTEGSPFGRNINGFMGFFRASYGTFLILPVPSTGGLAVIQVIILHLTLQSINLANYMNENIVQYFQGQFVTENGNASFSDESSVINPASIVSNSQIFSAEKNIAAPILYATAIKHLISKEITYIDNYQPVQDENGNQSSGAVSVSTDDFMVQTLEGEQFYDISEEVIDDDVNDEQTVEKNITFNFYAMKIKDLGFLWNSTYTPIISSFTVPCVEKAGSTSCDELKNKIEDLINKVDEDTSEKIQKIIVDSKTTNNGINFKEIVNNSSELLYENTGEFANTLKRVYEDLIERHIEESFQPFEMDEKSVKGGWMMAGTYYWVYSRMLNQVSDIYNFNVKSRITPLDELEGINVLLKNSTLFSSKEFLSDLNNVNKYTKEVIYNPSESEGFEKLYDLTVSNVSNINNAGVVSSIFSSIVPQVTPASFGQVDPVIALNTIGKVYFSISTLGATVIYGIYNFTHDDSKEDKGSLLSKAIDFTKKGIKSTPPGKAFSFFGGILGAYFAMILLAIGLMLLSMFIASLIYIFYLPLIVVFMWLGEMIKWIMFVIQSVFAGPVWAVSHVTLEGSGLAGERAKQGYMLLINILLRPSLLLAGLIVSMIMLRILGIMLSVIFLPALLFNMTSGANVETDGSVSQYLMHTLAVMSDAILFPFYIIMSIVFTVVITVTWVHRIFDMSFNFADDVMRWAGNGMNIGDRANSSEDKSTFVALLSDKVGRGANHLAKSGAGTLGKATTNKMKALGGGADSKGNSSSKNINPGLPPI